jgi:hypothetical protein
MITSKVNGVTVKEIGSKTTVAAKEVTVGDVCAAIEILEAAARCMTPIGLSKLMTDEAHAWHDEAYVEALALAGEAARQIQQDTWYVENADKIVDTRSFSGLESSFKLIQLTK